MKADVFVKNPLIKEFPAKLEVNDAKHTVYSTDSTEAVSIEFREKSGLVPEWVALYRFAGFGRPPELRCFCEPLD
jgi:hypothetical protein